MEETNWRWLKRRSDDGGRDDLTMVEETIWRWWKRRTGDGGRDDLAMVEETIWRWWKRRTGDGGRDDLAMVEETIWRWCKRRSGDDKTLTTAFCHDIHAHNRFNRWPSLVTETTNTTMLPTPKPQKSRNL